MKLYTYSELITKEGARILHSPLDGSIMAIRINGEFFRAIKCEPSKVPNVIKEGGHIETIRKFHYIGFVKA